MFSSNMLFLSISSWHDSFALGARMGISLQVGFNMTNQSCSHSSSLTTNFTNISLRRFF